MEHEYVVVLTTLPVEGDAAAFARKLVDERLAACVNVLPEMVSFYRWEGAVQQDAERQVVIKTRRNLVDALWQSVRAVHPYDVPEFVVLPIVGGSPDYLSWISGAATGITQE